MIINIFPFGIKHAFGNHNDHVIPNTITEYDADFICHKCFRRMHFTWQNNWQIINAKIYLAIKESIVLENKLFKKEK